MEMAEIGGQCAPGNALPVDRLSLPGVLALNAPRNPSVPACKALLCDLMTTKTIFAALAKQLPPTRTLSRGNVLQHSVLQRNDQVRCPKSRRLSGRSQLGALRTDQRSSQQKSQTAGQRNKRWQHWMLRSLPANQRAQENFAIFCGSHFAFPCTGALSSVSGELSL